MPRKGDNDKMKKIKKKWYLDFITCYDSIDHEGNRRLPDEMLEEEKFEMGEDEFSMEYELSFTGSMKHVWYGSQITKAFKEKRIKEFGSFDANNDYHGYYFANSPVFVSWDLG
jgi:Uri superfamily endonuclease